jgi:hypothetical protein
MTPPRKPTNTIDTTGNFFQRGKKPSTAHRVVTAKNASSQKVAPAKKRPAADVDQEDHSKEDEVSDEIDDADYSDEDDGQVSVHSDQDEAEHEEENQHVLIDEISSDDSDAEDLPQVQKTTAPRKSPITSSSSPAKKVEATQPKAAKRASTRRNKKDTYVAPNVGDVHVGCKLE